MPSGQLSLNNFLDPSTPSLRKRCDRGEIGGKTGETQGGKRKEIIMFIVATNIVASQLPEPQPIGTLTACAKSDIKSTLSVKLYLR